MDIKDTLNRCYLDGVCTLCGIASHEPASSWRVRSFLDGETCALSHARSLFKAATSPPTSIRGQLGHRVWLERGTVIANIYAWIPPRVINETSNNERCLISYGERINSLSVFTRFFFPSFFLSFSISSVLGFWGFLFFLPSVCLTFSVFYLSFLDASSHLIKRLCPSVGRSVGLSRFCQIYSFHLIFSCPSNV